MAEPTNRTEKEKELAAYLTLLLMMGPDKAGNFSWWIQNQPSHMWFQNRVVTSGIPDVVSRIALESHAKFTDQMGIPGSSMFAEAMARREAERYTSSLSRRLFARVQKWRGKVAGTLDDFPRRAGGPFNIPDIASGAPDIYPDYQIDAEASGIVTDVWANAETDASDHYGRNYGTPTVALWITEPGACPVCRPLHMRGPEVWKKQFPKGPLAHLNCNCYLQWSHLINH